MKTGRENLDKSFPIKSFSIFSILDILTFTAVLPGIYVLTMSQSEMMGSLSPRSEYFTYLSSNVCLVP